MNSHRESFCRFLADLANGVVSDEAWQSYVVNHYLDVALERARVDLVRAYIQADQLIEVPSELRAAARDLILRLDCDH